MCHITGKENVVADALPCADLSAVSLLTIDYHHLATDQAHSKEIVAYKTSITSLRFANIPFSDFTVVCDVSTGTNRPVIPSE